MLVNNKFNSKLSSILLNLKNNFFSDKLILSNNKFVEKFVDFKRLIFLTRFLLSDLSTVKISMENFFWDRFFDKTSIFLILLYLSL